MTHNNILKFYRMKEEVAGPSDMTKCIAYKTCKKTPDWSNEATPPATEAPATDPPATDPPATDPPATDPPATDPQVAQCCPKLVRLPTGGAPEIWTEVSSRNKPCLDVNFMVE